jgi:hypothetical protein
VTTTLRPSAARTLGVVNAAEVQLWRYCGCEWVGSVPLDLAR